jgi:hypothetical protein
MYTYVSSQRHSPAALSQYALDTRLGVLHIQGPRCAEPQIEAWFFGDPTQ